MNDTQEPVQQERKEPFYCIKCEGPRGHRIGCPDGYTPMGAAAFAALEASTPSEREEAETTAPNNGEGVREAHGALRRIARHADLYPLDAQIFAGLTGRQVVAACEVAVAALEAASPSVQETPASPQPTERERDGTALIVEERRRQVEREGWTPEHDDTHRWGDLAINAATLAVHYTDAVVDDPASAMEDGTVDPWGLVAKHGADPVRCLTIAGALIAAEIDRLQRRALSTDTAGGRESDDE